MKPSSVRYAAAVLGACAVLCGAGRVRAEEPNAILDLLERKGIITSEEAAQARQYYEKQQAATVAKYDKPKFGEWLDKVGLYGDARLRFEWRSGESQTATDGNRDRDRWRIRLRFGLQGDYHDDYFYGLRLETGNGARSTNLTFGDKGAPNGPFAKDNSTTPAGSSYSRSDYSIYLGRLFFGWKMNEHVTLIGGRQEIPFMNTSLVWDDDLNPEGAVEKFSVKTEKVDFFANLGQFVYADFDENAFGADGKADVWMLGWQVGGKVKFSKDISFTLAPTLYHYTAAKNFRGTFNPATNTGGINDLVVVDVPAEFAFLLGPVPTKIFGDFAVNLVGDDRAQAISDNQHDNQIYAYQAGASFGSSKKKGDWMLKAFWQHSEEYALDPNLVDSDLFDSRLNMQGFVLQGSYYFTDFLFAKLTYANATDIKKDLPTLNGAGDLGKNLHKYQLMQADLNWKF